MEHKILRTYNKAWRFERKIYGIDNIRLPFPINPDELVYFVIGILIVYGIFKALPFLDGIPVIIRYGIFPYILMKFLSKKKFDGKSPHKFLIAYIDYFFMPKKISRFQGSTSYKKGRFTPVVYRMKQIVNLTDQAINKGKKKGARINVSISY